MIEYFTALIIQYSIQDYSAKTEIWFETERECQQAFQFDEIASPLYDYLMDMYGNDIMMGCHPSSIISRETRPRTRPTEGK